MSDADLRFRRACDAQLGRAMRPLTLILGLILFACGVAAFFMLPGRAADLIGPYDAVMGAGFLFLHARLRTEPVRDGIAHPIAFVMGVSLMASAVIAAMLTGELAITNALLLFIMGAGVFLLSWRWYVAMAATTLAAWALAAAPLRNDAAFSLDAVLLVLALALGGLAHAARIGALRKLFESQWAVEEAQSRLRGVLDAAPAAFLAVDADGRVSFAAGSGLSARGWSDATMLGRAAADALPVDAVAARDALEGTPVSVASVVGERAFETRWVPLLDPQGQTRGALAVSIDVTDRKRAEEKLRIAHEHEAALSRLQEMDRFKTRILNTASHELNTPLTPIKLQLHLLKRESEAMDSRQRAAVAMLDRNFERLSTLVSDIMDVARLQEDRLKLKIAPMDLSPVVREAALSFEAAAQARGIRLVLDADRPVPASADARRILQVLFNLLSNALKFTPAGGEIHVRAAQDAEGAAIVEVRDTGIGIDAAKIADLFQPFSQVHDTTRSEAGGTGLGLYISRGIAEAHHGTLTAASAGAGHGTTFTLRLPGA